MAPHPAWDNRLFMAGMALYVQRQTAPPPPAEYLLAAMGRGATAGAETENRKYRRLISSAFRRWYHQAVPPVLRIERRWDGAAACWKLKVRQQPCHPGAAAEATRLGDSFGPWRCWACGEELPLGAQGLLVSIRPSRSFVSPICPAPASRGLVAVAGFSARWRLEIEAASPLSLLLPPLCRFRSLRPPWDAGQTLLRQAVLSPRRR